MDPLTSTPSNSGVDELESLGTIADLLTRATDEQRARMLRYVTDRFGVKVARSGGRRGARTS